MAIVDKNENGEDTYRYSEIFHSFQGEGRYTGVQTAWIRFFLCNLTCNGFGQKDPTNPETYILPYKDLDVSQFERIEDLPVFEYGCDSSYTWAKKFKHLAKNHTASEICDVIMDVCKSKTNVSGYFSHPTSHQHKHMAFTGGEPMLNQDAIVAIMNEFISRDNCPRYVTVETNGTKPFNKTHVLDNFITQAYATGPIHEWFWSVSPKLFSTSGEQFKKAIRPVVVGSYAEVSNRGQLKYVVDGSQQSWDEVEQATELFRRAGVYWDVFIMPVGATKEQQEEDRIANIAVEAIERGYNVSGRLHCYVFGNKIGT